MQRFFGRSAALATSLALGMMFVCSSVVAQSQQDVQSKQYKLTNLVSNQNGKAKHVDPLLVNAWGLVYGPGAPFWVSDAGSGWSTLYDGSGNPQTVQARLPKA